MKKTISLLLTLALTLTTFGTIAMAAPEAISQTEYDLDVETFYVKGDLVDGVASSYTTTYMNADTETDTDAVYNESCEVLSNVRTKDGVTGNVLNALSWMIYKVDISEIIDASSAEFTFAVRMRKKSSMYFRIYPLSNDAAENLTSGVSASNTTKTVSAISNEITAPDDDDILLSWSHEKSVTTHNWTISDTSDTALDTANDIPQMDGAAFMDHVEKAVADGEDAVYFLAFYRAGTNDALTSTACLADVYHMGSVDYAPSFKVTGSSITSEVEKTANGYTYTAGNLSGYTDDAMVIVAAYDAQGTLITFATNSDTDGEVSVDINCPEAASFKAYIWETKTLEPITYPETISLTQE